MKKALVATVCLAIATAGPIFARQAGGGSTAGANAAGPDLGVMKVQVILDRLGFTPGVIDGRPGRSLAVALAGFQEAQGLTPSGRLDAPTRAALGRYDRIPATVTVRIARADMAGPFLHPTPDDPEAQAQLARLPYQSPLERLAERFHTTPATIVALNSPDTPLRAGTPIVVPAALPYSRDYAVDDPTARGLLNGLNVDARAPRADRVVVDKSDGVLRAYRGDRLVAQFPATMGSTANPLPIGRWTIRGIAYDPDWRYDPRLLTGADKSDEPMIIPPGPNNPVGVVWHDLSKEHYGIHGTSEPEQIGRAESNGCIRLTNWDAARLSLMVRPGTPAIFQE